MENLAFSVSCEYLEMVCAVFPVGGSAFEAGLMLKKLWKLKYEEIWQIDDDVGDA